MPYKDLSKNLANLYRNPNGGKSQAQTTSDDFNAITNAYLAAAAVKTTSAKAPTKKSSGIVTASDEKKSKSPEIKALGAGDYGAGSNTRVDKVLRGAGESTAASYLSALGTLAGGTGELTMGQSAQAAVKGQSQQKLEQKKEKQQDKVQQKLYDKADKLSAKSEKEIQSAKKGLGKVGQILVDAGVAGTQLLGDAALNAVTPGAGLVGMGLRSFGSGAQEQRQKGGSETDQFLGGLKSAGIEILTEKIGGPFEKVYGKSFLGKAINESVEKLGKSGAVGDVLKFVANSGTEAVEEVVSDILNPLADRLLDLDGKRGSGAAIGVFSKANVQRMIEDGIVGGLLGMVGAGGQVVGNRVQLNQNIERGQEAARNAYRDVIGIGNMTSEEVARRAAQEALAGRLQTTSPEAVKADTAQQAQLNSALQAEQPQVAANPLVAAVQNAQRQQAQTATPTLANESIETDTAQIVARVEQTIDDVVATSIENGENLTDEQAFAEIAQFPEQYGLTTADVEEYSANLRDYEFEDYNNPELPEGMGAASASFTGDASPVEQWVANAQYEGDSALHPISDEQIANLAEQQQRAPTEVPRVDVNGRLTSKTVSTLVNSGVTPEAMSDAIMQDAMNGKFSRIAYTDEAALANAENKIENSKWGPAFGEFRKDVLDGKVSKDITALGITLYNNAVTAGDYAAALDVVSLLVKNSTAAAQSLQATRILNKLSPDARLYTAMTAIDNIAAEIKQKYNLDDDIEIDPDLLGEYKEALDSGDKNAIREAWGNVEQNIADQIPPNWKDKFNAWRYLSMLGNPRTHVRNIVGNAGFAPVIAIKNAIATGIESGVEKLGGNIDRTKALLNPASAADRALIATAWADYANASEAIMAGGKYNDLPNTIDDRRQIFKAKPLEAVRKFNSNALNVEDKWFSQPAYANALASYLKANGITAKEYAEGGLSEEAMAKAQAYAVKEAQKATYRDANAFSQAVSKFRVKPAKEDATRIEKGLNKAANIAVEGLLPFKKTPANILARAVEYSPLGLGAEVLTGVRDVKNGTKSAAEFIDGLSAGLTGTGLLALGIYLASQGLLSGGASGDDKQDEFNKLQGGQDYALSVGDKTVTLDWLAPEALPLFVGVEYWNNRMRSDDDASFWNILDSVGSISEPMLEMSMLQGIQDVIDSVGYSDKKIQAIAGQVATSYISQFVPTLFGQIERTFGEDTRQTTFVDKSAETPGDIQRFLGKLLNKTPGEYQQMDYIDAWGRTQSTGTILNRALNNFVNPSYISDKQSSDVEAELQRLYNKGAGFENVLPSRVSQSTAIEGENLTQEEYQKFATTKGQTSFDVLDDLMSSSIYRGLSDSAKAAAIKDAYEYANDKAKRSVKSGADVSSWYEKAKDSGNPAKYIVARAELNQALGGEPASYEKTVAALDKGLSEDAAYASFNSDQAEKFDAIKDTGVSATDYIYAKNYYSNVAKGKNKKNDVAAYIQSLPESKEAKLALYQACYNRDTKSEYTSLNYWTDTSGGQRKQSKSNQDDRMLSLFPFG